jgi:hypothetical protein
MLTFPGQDERAAEIRHDLAKEFDFAERVFEFWMRALKDEWLAKCSLPPIVTRGTAMPLNTQACRLFQSLLECCNRADAFSADILARSLFETLLATCFVLQKEFSYLPALVPQGAPIEAEQRLPEDLRAKLYMSFQALRTKRHGARLATDERFQALATTVADRYPPIVFERIASELDPEWIKVLTKAPTYSGLKINELAITLGHIYEYWYSSFYFLQSRNAHGADAVQHVNDYFGPLYFSDGVDTCTALYAGTSMFILCIRTAHEYIHFGDEVTRRFDELYREYDTLWSPTIRQPSTAHRDA